MINAEKYLPPGLRISVFKVLLQLLDNTQRPFLSLSETETSVPYYRKAFQQNE